MVSLQRCFIFLNAFGLKRVLMITASCSVPQVGGKQAIYVKDIYSNGWSEPILNSSVFNTEAENLRKKVF